MPLLVIFLTLLLIAAPSGAAMHKCVDADGNVTYSQTACGEPLPSVRQPVASGGAAPASAVGGAEARGDPRCDLVRAYALELAFAMRDGVAVDAAIGALGAGRSSVAAGSYSALRGRASDGRVGMGDDALEVVSHVFAFAGRGAVVPEQVADAVAAKCRRGGIAFERGAPGGADGIPLLSGSGILLNAQGMVLTADAIVGGCGGLRVSGGDSWYTAKVLRRDQTSGLAVLVASGLRGRPAVFADQDTAADEALYLVSRPLRDVITGATSVVPTRMQEPPSPTARLAFDNEAPARTGAPLLSSGGLVAGIALSGADGAEAGLAAMPGSALRAYLGAEDLAYYRAAALGKLSEHEIRRRAAGFTVHVECTP